MFRPDMSKRDCEIKLVPSHALHANWIGNPADRLAATGFAQFQPLDDRGDEIAYRRPIEYRWSKANPAQSIGHGIPMPQNQAGFETRPARSASGK